MIVNSCVNFYAALMFFKKIKFNTLIGAWPILMAATTDGYIFKTRNYNY